MTSTPAVTTSKSRFLSNAYCRFLHFAARLDTPFLFAVRVYWGWQFLQDGWGKLHNLQRVSEYFASLGLPFPGVNALVIGAAQLVGGALLIAGLATRLVGLGLSIIMIGAFVTADREALATIFSSDPSKFFNADPFTFLFAALIALVFGAGMASVDYWLAQRRKS
jgi:putative oxidoreductase